jgi:sec-independent protein translocase protein TatB
MFEIGFSEMMVIAVVALIVIGPERLPGVARTLGHLFGRMQRYVNDVKSDIQREVELDELRKLRESVETSARDIQQSVSRDLQAVEQEMHDLQTLANPLPEDRAGKNADMTGPRPPDSGPTLAGDTPAPFTEAATPAPATAIDTPAPATSTDTPAPATAPVPGDQQHRRA